jgi:hypothetical protein
MPLDNYNTRPDFSRQIKQYSGTTAILSGETNILEKFSIKSIELDTNGALAGDLLLYNGSKFTPAAQGSFVNIILNGLILTYNSGLTYNVSSGSYQINNQPYIYTGGTVNILSGDSLYSRFDVVFITTAKTPTVLSGTPSLAPVVPLISSATQVQIGIISVPALFTGGTGSTILQLTSNTVFDYYPAGSGIQRAGAYDAQASGEFSFAPSKDSRAYGQNSIAMGLGAKASGNSQTVVGQYNDPNTTDYFIVGNGTSDGSRANAFRVTTSGDTYANKKLFVTNVEIETTGASSNHALISDGSKFKSQLLTLQKVTESGNTTTNSIKVGQISATSIFLSSGFTFISGYNSYSNPSELRVLLADDLGSQESLTDIYQLNYFTENITKGINPLARGVYSAFTGGPIFGYTRTGTSITVGKESFVKITGITSGDTAIGTVFRNRFETKAYNLYNGVDDTTKNLVGTAFFNQINSTKSNTTPFVGTLMETHLLGDQSPTFHNEIRNLQLGVFNRAWTLITSAQSLFDLYINRPTVNKEGYNSYSGVGTGTQTLRLNKHAGIFIESREKISSNDVLNRTLITSYASVIFENKPWSLFAEADRGYVGSTLVLASALTLASTTRGAWLDIGQSQATRPHINLSAGTNPSSPQIGDLWWNGTELYFRKDGSTSVNLLSGGTGGSSTGLTTGTSLGAGVKVLFSSDTTSLSFATLSSQTPSTLSIISSSTGVILFSATTGSGGISGTYVSGLTSSGTGNILLLSSITNNNLIHKSISAGTGMQITESNGTLLFVSTATGGTAGSGSTSGTSLGNGVKVLFSSDTSNLAFVTLSSLTPSTLSIISSSTGVILFSATTGSGGTLTGNFLPLSGGTLTGGLSATTISATSIDRLNYIDFNTAATPSSLFGRVYFDGAEQSLSYFGQGITEIKIGQQLYSRVYNNTGAVLTKGTAVKVTGATLGLPTICPAIAIHTGDNTVIGLVANNIANNSEGLVINNGLISGLTLNNFVVGDLLYLSPTSAGTYVNSLTGYGYNIRTNVIGRVVATGSTTGQIYVNTDNEDSTLSLTNLERNILEGNTISTGIYEFTGITTGSTNTTFNISPVRGWITYNTYQYATSPEVTNIYYSGGTNLTTPFLTSNTQTYILLTSASTISYQTTFPTPQQRRENIYLGKLGHGTRTTILNVFNEPDSDISPLSQLRDMFTPIKLINDGVLVSANGANLNINTSAGVLYGMGIGFATNQLNPNSLTINATTPTTFQYRTQTGGTGGAFTSTTTVDVGFYDLNGVRTAVGSPAKQATNQRIFMLQNGQFRIQYGQTKYTDLATAIAAVDTESFTTFQNFRDNAILIGVLSVRSDATALINIAQAKFTFASKFGEVVGGTGGIATTTLQQAYDNSATPEIVTNSAEGALTIKNGTGNPNNVTNLLEGIDSTDVTTSFIRADGTISGLTFLGTSLSLVEGSYFNTLSSSTLTNNRTINLPDNDGTVALLNDLTYYLPLTGGTLTGGLTGVTFALDQTQGGIKLYDLANPNYYNNIIANAKLDRTHTLPDKDGTFAMLSDITFSLTSAGTGNILLLSSITGNNLVYKSISAGTGMNITESNGTLVFVSTGGTSSTGITTATNVGTGVNILFSSSTTNLGFATLSSQTPSTLSIISSSTGVILFSATTGGISGTYVSGVTSAGTGTILLLSGTVVNNNIVQKSLSAGTNVTITESNGTLIFSSTGGSGSGFSAATSVGTGLSIISSATNNTLRLFTLSGTNGFVVTTAATGLMTFRGPNTPNTVIMTDASGNMVNSDFLNTDNANDTLGIGIAAVTTARLLLPFQTAAITPLRFSKTATDYTGGVDGSIWYLTAGNSLKFNKGTGSTTDFIFKDNNNSLSSSTTPSRVVEVNSGGTLSASRIFTSFGVFNSITSTTISSTTSETSIIPTGSSIIGSATLLALTGTTPQLVTGKKYRFTANGNITTKSSPAGNLTARMKLGSSVIASISGFSLHPSISSPNNFFIQSTFTIRSASSTGTVVGSGFLQTDNNNLLSGATNIVGLNNLGQITVDCTTDKIFDFTFQFSTADASNTITINEATLEYLN